MIPKIMQAILAKPGEERSLRFFADKKNKAKRVCNTITQRFFKALPLAIKIFGLIFDYSQNVIKILLLMKSNFGIGQELNCLPKSLVLILTLSPKVSLLRVIENSPLVAGILDSQERKTKGGHHGSTKS